MYSSKDTINTAYNYIQGLKARGHSYGGYPVYNVTKDDLTELAKITDRYNLPFPWMINLINFESGRTFNPAIKNSIGATGLIQFLPSTANGLGTTTDALSKMTFKQQLFYLDKYLYGALKNHLVGGKVPDSFTQGDLFMAIFYPVAVGKPNYVFPNNVKAANSGISTPYDYVQKALLASVFPLNVVPYTLADVKRKFGSVTGYTKKNWVPILIISVLLILAILLLIFRKKIAEKLTKL